MKSKWESEKENLEQLILVENLSYEEIGRRYGCSGGNIKKVALRLGIELSPRRTINECETFNKKAPSIAICLNCGKEFMKYPGSTGKYCSRECSSEHRGKKYIEDWKTGKISGTTNYTCSDFVRNYLIKKHNSRCQLCGWGEVNPFTNKVPLQIHHIDGNSENNAEENLQVLCPNCHSLTENFGSRNTNAPRGKSSYYGKAKK